MVYKGGPTVCFTACLCSSGGGKSCHWVNSSVQLPDGGFQFELSHSLSPYAEESTMLEVTAEAITDIFILRRTKRFYLRDISKWNWATLKTSNWRLLRLNSKQQKTQQKKTKPNNNCHFSSVQFSPIVPRLSSIRRWSRTWTWPLIHRPAGQLLTASSVWSTRLNMCWKMTARYTQACTETNSMSVIASIAFDFLIEWSVWLYRPDVLHLLWYRRGSASWGFAPETPWCCPPGASGLPGKM